MVIKTVSKVGIYSFFFGALLVGSVFGLTVPNTLSNGSVADAEELNANFSAITDAFNGPQMNVSGNLHVDEIHNSGALKLSGNVNVSGNLNAPILNSTNINTQTLSAQSISATNIILSQGIKIGDDSSTASPSLAGTLRWNGNLQFCDGQSWITLAVVSQTTSNHQVFTSNGNFIVPNGVSSIDVIAIGGGAGGSAGHSAGGSSGFVSHSINQNVSAGDNITVTIGMGGTGGIKSPMTQAGNGGNTSFGSYLTANGAQASNGNQSSNDGSGGSGGGGYGNSGYGGNGGSGGSNGDAGNTGSGTSGQGDYSSILANFNNISISAGSGGDKGSSSHAGGGGGGGLLISGHSATQTATQGAGSSSGQPGLGFGAGGGAGGYTNSGSVYYTGGQGASGVVYIQW
jgi:hypothetical protein